MLMRITAAVAALCLGCPAAAQQYDLFKTYDAMRMPKAGVPVGARWIANSGPTGAATAPDNIDVQKGLASITFTKESKRALSASLGSFLGLSHDEARAMKVTLSGIEIHKVRDLTKLTGLQANQAFLAAAVKAKRIHIAANSSTLSKIQASAPVNGLPVVDGTTTATGSASSASSGSLTLDGEDLFVAYQLLRFAGKPAKKKSIAHRGQPFELEGYSFKFCQCGDSPSGMAVYVTDPALGADGQITMTKWNISTGAAGFTEFALPASFANNDVARATVRVRFHQTMEPCIVIAGSSAMCFDPSYNTAELTTASFQIRPYSDNKAPF